MLLLRYAPIGSFAFALGTTKENPALKYNLTHHSHYNMTADADQSKYLNPYHYIKEQREAHQLDAGWEMDPANYADYLEDMDIIDVSQEEMELYLREVS